LAEDCRVDRPSPRLRQIVRLRCPEELTSLEFLGDAGRLVPSTDVAALADAVDRIITGPGLAAALSANGRRRAALFGWDRTAVGHADLPRIQKATA
jgi:glycosyltransferase involved in cell wall biosynthesis